MQYKVAVLLVGIRL